MLNRQGCLRQPCKSPQKKAPFDSEELGDDTVLSDVGIDPLLGLMIASRFRDELAMDIDAATLHEFDTIKGLKKRSSWSALMMSSQKIT